MAEVKVIDPQTGSKKMTVQGGTESAALAQAVRSEMELHEPSPRLRTGMKFRRRIRRITIEYFEEFIPE